MDDNARALSSIKAAENAGNSSMSEVERLKADLEAARAENAALRRQLEDTGQRRAYAEAFDNSSEAIVIYDKDGLLVACNRSFRELYGYSEEEARPGVHFAELGRIDMERGNVIVGDEFGDDDDYLRRKAEFRQKLEGSFIVRLKDGRWIKTSDRPFGGGGFVSIQIDVTEIKKNEEELRAAKEAAEEAVHSKSEFLANISHDLRTPLNAIMGFSDMILSEVGGPLENEKYRSYLQNIHKSGSLLLSIVDDILDTARLDSGKFTLRPQIFDLVECSSEVIEGFAPIALAKNVAIDLIVPEGCPRDIFMDRRSLIQILNNLISNSCKHTDPGGSVTVEWHTPKDDRIAVSVIDNGAGMPQELVDKIGEPFLFDGTSTAPSNERGTGLGIYICTKLTAALGGTMDVSSALGEGTTFTVSWPYQRRARPTGAPFHI
jgi:two-component system cell cycle sensor histidine kinase PleC